MFACKTRLIPRAAARRSSVFSEKRGPQTSCVSVFCSKMRMIVGSSFYVFTNNSDLKEVFGSSSSTRIGFWWALVFAALVFLSLLHFLPDLFVQFIQLFVLIFYFGPKSKLMEHIIVCACACVREYVREVHPSSLIALLPAQTARQDSKVLRRATSPG